MAEMNQNKNQGSAQRQNEGKVGQQEQYKQGQEGNLDKEIGSQTESSQFPKQQPSEQVTP